MSQHIFHTKTASGEGATVTMGYDRPLDYVFCTVVAENGNILYSNLDDEHAGTHQKDVEYFRPVLAKLGFPVPESMYREVVSDQDQRIGNRVLVHGE